MTTATPSSPATVPAADSGRGETVATKRYRVFLSYSHSDTKWAQWLMRRLETYRVPARFRGRAAPIGEVGPRIAPVFRDRDELPTTSDLGETIRASLRESATLVVICSPRSAKSRWVQAEIVAFKRMGGERRVFGFIVDGEPTSEGADGDCFSPALRAELGPDGDLSTRPAEIVAADARAQGDGRELAFVRLIAGLLGVGFDELRQREHARQLRRLMWVAAGSAVGMAAMLGLAVTAWRARNDAQRRQEQAEDVLAFMLGDFRDDLKKVGQLALLEKVGNKAQAYFDRADPRDLTDSALTRQAKALTQIGEVRLDLKDVRYAEAALAFGAAYQRASELAARHPRNGDMLFERAQAEYWIGFVARRRGDASTEREWFTRYRDSTVALVAIEGQSPRAQGELAYGYHNLAVVDMGLGNLAEARRGFRAESIVVAGLSAATPADLQLRFRLADIASWLGSVAERDGDYAEAIEHFSDETSRLEALVALEPAVAYWRQILAEGLAFTGNVRALTGHPADAVAAYTRAIALLEALVAQDPKNRLWQRAALNIQLKQAELLLGQGDKAAASLLSGARDKLAALVKAEPTSSVFTATLAIAWRLEAQWRLLTHAPDAADAAVRALELGAGLVNGARADYKAVGDYAQSCVLAGRIEIARSRPDLARQHWNRCLEVLAPRLPGSSDWRALDPAAQALVLLGKIDEARPLAERLRRLGYHPINPLAASLLDSAFSPVSPIQNN